MDRTDRGAPTERKKAGESGSYRQPTLRARPTGPGPPAHGSGELVPADAGVHLVVCEGELIGRRFPVEPGLVLGRSADADIQIPDAGASRRHARFIAIDGHIGVEDLGSHNGLYVNRSRVVRTVLRVGDVLRIGDTPLALHVPSSAGRRRRRGIVDVIDEAAAIVPASALSHPTLAQVSTDEFLDALGIPGEDDTHEASPELMRRMLVRTRHFAVVYGICREIGATARLDVLLSRAIEHVHKVTAARRAHIVLLSETAPEPETIVSCGPDGVTSSSPDDVSRTIIGWVVENQSAVLTTDARSDQRFADGASVSDLRLGSVLCVPMLRDGAVIGVLKLEREPGDGRFRDEDLRLASVITPILAVAVHNARLSQRQQETIRELRQAHAELVRAQEALVAREKMAVVGRFAAGMAHEIRNALVPLSLLDDVLEDLPAGAPSVDDVRLMQEATGRLRVLVEEIRTLARDEDAPLLLRPNDLKRTLQGVIAVIRCDPNVRRHTVRVEGEAVPPFAYDDARLKQVLINLVHHAAQTLEASGTIRIRYGRDRSRADEVRIEVVDDGPGMTPDALATLWQPAFQTGSGEEMGLSLDLARRIVERHEGSISARSEVGEGTTVSIRLPRTLRPTPA